MQRENAQHAAVICAAVPWQCPAWAAIVFAGPGVVDGIHAIVAASWLVVGCASGLSTEPVTAESRLCSLDP